MDTLWFLVSPRPHHSTSCNSSDTVPLIIPIIIGRTHPHTCTLLWLPGKWCQCNTIFPRGGSSSHCIPATSISYSRTMTYATLKPNSEGQMEELYKLSSSYSEILTLTCWWYSTESAVTLTNSDHVSDKNESRETDVLSVSSLKVWSRRVR